MEKLQRRAVGADRAVRLDLYFASAYIPARHVVTGIALDTHAIEEARDEIAPFLVGEYSIRNIVITGEVQLLRPPVCELVADGVVSHGAKAQIVNAILQRSQFVILHETFALVWRHLVRRQNN